MAAGQFLEDGSRTSSTAPTATCCSSYRPWVAWAGREWLPVGHRADRL